MASSSASVPAHTIEYNDIILSLSDLISSEVNKYLDKKANKKKLIFTDDTIKTQVNNFFKTDSTIITGAEAAATAADKAALSVTQRKKNITKAITDYLKTVITETTVKSKYDELVAGTAAPSVISTVTLAPVVTALATATPVTATGIPIVAATATATTSGGPYEIILDTDKMKFFVYNLFAHDLAHDLFPSGTGLKRVVEIKSDTSNPTRTTFLNTPHDNSDITYGGKLYTNKAYKTELKFDDDDDETKKEIKKQEIDNYNEEIKELGLYKKIEREGEGKTKYEIDLVDESELLEKKKKLDQLVKEDKKNNNEDEEKPEIQEKKNEIENIKTEIIINKTREFSIDVVKSAGITLEQKGMLWINQAKKRFEDTDIINRLFLIIDVDTIIDDFVYKPNSEEIDLNEIYLKNPMYPGYIYFDNYIVHPYDIIVTRKGPHQIKNSNVNFTLTFTTINPNNSQNNHTISFNPYVNEFQITFDNTKYRKICYDNQNCELNFKDAYNSVIKVSKNVNAYEFFSSIFNNYINVEISDDMDSYFYFLYPKFLLKYQEDNTKQKFNELLGTINSINVDDINFDNTNLSQQIEQYINFYREPFKCFQSKICKYLQEKQTEFLNKYGEIEKDENGEETPIFLFPKNIQNCTNTDFFLFSLSKMFAQMIVNENKENKDEIFEKIDEIVRKYVSNKTPDFNPIATDGEEKMVQDPEYIAFLKLMLLNYPIVSKQIETQSGGGVNDNYSKNAARIISTSVASIMYYLDKVSVPTNNILNTEINICQNIVTKQQASNIDDKLFDDFYTWTTMTKYAGDLKYYNNNVASSLPGVSFEKKAKPITSKKTSSPGTSTEPAYSSDTIVGLPSVDFWNWLEIGKPDNYGKNLFLINNAASAPNELSSRRLAKSYLLNWFTKARIDAVDKDASELSEPQLNTMIADVKKNGTVNEKANLKLKEDYETFNQMLTPASPARDNKFWFCPFSSIIDGQPTCKRFLNRGDIKEKGTLFVTVRNLKSATAPGGGVDKNEMIYTIKIEPKPVFGNRLTGEHKVLVHVLLKIGGVKIIDYGTLDSKGVAAMTDEQLPADPAIEIDLDSDASYLDAKECMIRLIDLSIGLLKNHSNKVRSWEQLITKLKSDNIVSSSTTASGVAVKMPFKLHTPGTISTYTDASYTSDQLRQKILRTSVIKSLGDYSQELNMVTKNSGYVDNPQTIPRFIDNKKNTPEEELDKTSIRKPEDIRLGLSVDRPSGVRLILLKLFGKQNSANPNSGTNPRSIVGYYDTLSKAMIAYDKSQFPPSSGSIPGVNYDNDTEDKVLDYKGGKKKIIRKSRKIVKRRKNITKKRKILLKNRKISKRNNKGTRKRK